MNMIKRSAFGAIAVVSAGLLLAACGEAPEETPAPAESGEASAPADAGGETSDFLPCIVSDFGGFDDKSFNQLSLEGVEEAANELGVEFKQVESNAETDYAPNLNALVAQGCSAIASVGFALAPATIDAANSNPDIDFILIDDAADADFDGKADAETIKPLLYDTAQAAFLAGYLSAGYSEAGKVGTFGGQEFPTVTIFMDGFKQGVDHYNEVKGTDVEVVGWDGETGSFTGGFEAGPEAKTVAQNIIDQGVDVLLPVGGPIYQSALQAIKEADRDIALIGADADLFESDPTTADFVLTSILKNMHLSTYEAVMASADGSFDPTAYVGTLENDGVGIADLHNFADKVDPALLEEVEALKAEIISGELEVASYLG
ncbi:BMP family ABC transporter substrate-binding protein [Microbacterium nanhaiense]|uniref:BMP family ABC transporter substrate-binding protein n=1 Tax=Microbacterium nanhaiense TaxID=1301026 RepID=A0ABQ2N173_9MICO|nr:BMP family ABC transporter substrate-binding protein [Microbacterium nanhaiense]GGO62757.1 BMP family ABC transporter substrate-binding protein [Microbacterium nanhaiense]